MPTREEYMEALKRADAAGNADDARKLAQLIRNMDQSSPNVPVLGRDVQGVRIDNRTPGQLIEDFNPKKIDRPQQYVQSGDQLMAVSRKKDTSIPQAISLGITDMGNTVPGVPAAQAAMMNATGLRLADQGQIGDPYVRGQEAPEGPVTGKDVRAAFDPVMAKAAEERPYSFGGGQGIGLIAGGAGSLYEKGVNLAPRLVAPSLMAKAGPAAKLLGRGVAHSAMGAVDYALYNAVADSQNKARAEGRSSADVTLGERAGEFGKTLTDPLAYLFGPATLGVSRVGHALLGAPLKTLEASKAAGKFTPRLGDATPKAVQAAQQGPHQWIGDDIDAFMQKNPAVQRIMGRSAQGGPMPPGMSQDRYDAIKHVLKRGLDPDQVEQYVNMYEYAGKGDVTEALGLLSDSSKIDALNVALANIPGDAQTQWRDFFAVFRDGSAEQVQRYLRQATGISADDYTSFVQQLRDKRVTEPAPAYEAAAAKQIAPETWDNQILPALLRFDGGPDAVRKAAAQTASIDKPGSLEAAQELYRLADEIEAVRSAASEAGFAGGLLPTGDIAQLSQQAGRAVERPRQVSTLALIELDKFLGGMAQSTGRQEPHLAGSIRNTQTAIRGTGRATGLDPETGADAARKISQRYKIAEDAVIYGEEQFKNGKPLRKLVDDFRLAGNAEMDDLAKASLLMGWLRAAEDAIESSGGSAQVINKIYGSPNQRAKLMAMMPKLDAAERAGVKGNNTKNIKALVGGKAQIRGQTMDMPSIFERQRNVLNAEKRMTGGSPTTPKAAAILGESEVTKFVDDVLNAVLNPRQAIQEGGRKVLHKFWKPPIMKEGINRELGDILTTTGGNNIRRTLDEIRSVQNARPGPRKPPSGQIPPPNAPIRSNGFNLQRPQGFHDDIPRGTARFYDERLTAGENKAVEMARNGYSNDEIAEEMAAPIASVKTWLSKARSKGVDVPKARNAPPATAFERLYPRFEKGQSDQQIAQALGMNPRTVASHRVRFNKARRASGEKPISSIKWKNAGSGNPGISTSLGDDVISSMWLGLAGNAGGDLTGRFIDLNGDGVVDEKDRELGRRIGGVAAAGPLASRLARGPARGLMNGETMLGVGGKRPPKGPLLPGAGTGPKNRKHLGRGLKEMTDDNVVQMPQRNPVSMGEGRTPEQLAGPYGGKPPSQWTPEERAFFVNSGHGRTSRTDTKDPNRKPRMMGGKETADYLRSKGHTVPKLAGRDGRETADALALGGIGLGVLGGIGGVTYLMSKNKGQNPNMPPGLAQARQQAAQEVANLYQSAPNSREFQVAVIRLQQIDGQIEQLTNNAPANAPPPPSYKPPRLAQ